MTKERNQNPIVGDTVKLRLITYNSNNYKDINAIEYVKIYFLDPNLCSALNKDGRRFIAEFSSSSIVQDSEGFYHLDLSTYAPTYVVGKYIDQWKVQFTDNDQYVDVDNLFTLYPDLWYTTTIPPVYSFDFTFQPNKIRQGSVKWLMIQINPNIPKASDLERYYMNLAIVADLYITLEQVCGPCVPEEKDLRTIFEDVQIDYRDKLMGYYLLDTRELDCGIYNLTVKMNFAGTIDVSPKMQLQIY